MFLGDDCILSCRIFITVSNDNYVEIIFAVITANFFRNIQPIVARYYLIVANACITSVDITRFLGELSMCPALMSLVYNICSASFRL